MPIKRGVIEALSSSDIENFNGIFAGGDCVTGPATVIRAIAAGKVAAANIDEYLGFHHVITCDVEIPLPGFPTGLPQAESISPNGWPRNGRRTLSFWNAA